MLSIETGVQNQVLRTPCATVTEFDDSLKKIIEEMTQTMLEPTDNGVTGVGLAANQVGINKRILLITLNVNTRKRQKVLPMVNPEIVELSPATTILEEGCLSLPELYAKVSRPAKVKVRWQNENGDICERKFEKWDARIFLHEFDHLEGKLFVDYLSETEKKALFQSAASHIKM
jgi:peptide deformylase